MDLKRLSQDTLIHIITDLQKRNDELKEENDKLKEEIGKLKEEIDIKKIYINDISRKLSLQPIIEKKDAQTITDNSNVMSFYDELKSEKHINNDSLIINHKNIF